MKAPASILHHEGDGSLLFSVSFCLGMDECPATWMCALNHYNFSLVDERSLNLNASSLALVQILLVIQLTYRIACQAFPRRLFYIENNAYLLFSAACFMQAGGIVVIAKHCPGD